MKFDEIFVSKYERKCNLELFFRCNEIIKKWYVDQPSELVSII